MIKFLDSVNVVTGLMICIFAIPILVGIIRPLTSGTIRRSFAWLLNSLILLASAFLSVYLTKIILYGNDNFVLTILYKVFPALENAVVSKQLWVYIMFLLTILLISDGILYLLTIPIRRYAIAPMSTKISVGVNAMGSVVKRAIGGLWQLPKSIGLVLVFSILLNFYTGFFNSSFITEDANKSAPYQLVQENAIAPLLSSSAVKNIQVILDDSFTQTESENNDGNGFNLQLVKYFNGVTLEEAVKSNTEIDDMASSIVGSETDDRQKAYLIYLWICKNLKYDNSKAAKIANNPSDVDSGAIVAFATRTGVCFDFSCLYVAMCRATGLNVRFIIGSGFTGTVWGDHAWNQVYDPKENRWIDVDTTFGSSGINYFDKPHFYLDHRDGAIQGEW